MKSRLKQIAYKTSRELEMYACVFVKTILYCVEYMYVHNNRSCHHASKLMTPSLTARFLPWQFFVLVFEDLTAFKIKIREAVWPSG